MPATTRDQKSEKKEHIHTWRESIRPFEKVCECGKILINSEEYERRVKEWDAYFELVKTTPSNQDFQKIKELIKTREWNDVRDEIKEIGKRAKERLEKDEYLPKPEFPDPIGESWKYVIEE